MAKLIQAQPGQTIKVDGKVYEADENGVLTVKDKHVATVMQSGLKEVKHVDWTDAAPTHEDDVRKGFSIGSIWQSFAGFFRCAANTAGAAAWEVVDQDRVHIPEPVEKEPETVTLAVQPENEAAAAAALKVATTAQE